MIVKHDLSTKLQVELVVELLYTLKDTLVLLVEVFFVVKTNRLGHGVTLFQFR